MKMHLKYASYVLRHKWFVFLAGRKTGAPLWRLVIHDWSKLTPAEWGPYARRFFGGRAGVEDKALDPVEFHKAWAHHWHLNPHHWNHWLSVDGREVAPMPMPDHFIREMVADWAGAGRAITGKWELEEWYSKTREKMVLHPETAERVDSLMSLVADREITK